MIWAWSEAPEESYWNYYQWWANTPHIETNYSPNDNAWWWESDNNGLVYPVTNGRERQWPCDTWYHVPSQWEWYALMDMWAGLSVSWRFNNSAWDSYSIPDFYTDFQIPFAGYYGYEGSNAYLWSSSPWVNGTANAFYMDDFENGVVDATYASDYRTYGFPVRCFKDSALGSSSSETGDGSGWNSKIMVNISDFNSWQNTCTGSNFLFENIVAWTSTGTYTRSWVFECAFGNGKSSPIVTLQLSWNLVASWDRVISWSNLEMINSEWTVTPGWLKFAQTLSETYKALTATQELFHKSADLIWVASWVVTIKLTVPWWTPDGTYNWTLVLTY